MTPELMTLKKKTIDGMVSYMKYGAADGENDPEYDPSFKADYTQKNIDQCEAILDGMLADLASPRIQSQAAMIRQAVQRAVVKLNKLNEVCEGGLIETGQRENLRELIIAAAKHAGLTVEGDITEEWREW